MFVEPVNLPVGQKVLLLQPSDVLPAVVVISGHMLRKQDSDNVDMDNSVNIPQSFTY